MSLMVIENFFYLSESNVASRFLKRVSQILISKWWSGGVFKLSFA